MKIHNNAFLQLVEEALEKVPEIDIHQVNQKLQKQDNFFLIDGTHRNTQVTREFTYCINNLISNNRVDFVLDDAMHAEPLKNNIFSYT